MRTSRRGFITVTLSTLLAGCSQPLLQDEDPVEQEYADSNRVRAEIDFTIEENGTIIAELVDEGTTLSIYAQIGGSDFENNTMTTVGDKVTIEPEQYITENGRENIVFYGISEQQYAELYEIKTNRISIE